MDHTNSDYMRFAQPGDREGLSDPATIDPPENQGGGGGTASAELPGVTQQPARQSDEPPDGDPPVNT